MIRWGILSTANIAKTQLIPAILEANGAKLMAISSREFDKAKFVADTFGIPKVYGSYEELLNSDEVDAVYIPLPTSDHVNWSIKAAKAGKHVLCEKPIAMKESQINELIETSASTGKIITEAFMIYYHPQWEKIKALLADKKIGELKKVEGSFTYFNKDPKNMRNILKLGGGALPDIGVYPVVATRIATNLEPESVAAEIHFDSKFKTDTYVNAQVYFEGFDLSFYVSTQMSLRQKVVFHGDKGRIEVHAPFNARVYDYARITIHSIDNSHAEEIQFGEVNQYTLQIEEVNQAIEKLDQSRIFSLENSKLNQKVIDAIYKSGMSRKREKLF